MVVGSMTVETDVVVLGSGPGGYVAAIRAAQLGNDVTLVEKESVLGGVCLNHGCIPTKALIHASNFLSTISSLKDMGITIKDYDVDIPKMISWKASIVKRLNDGVAGLLKRNGVEVIKGKGVFKSSDEIHIEGKSDVTAVKFKHAIVATGSLPIEIPGFSFDNPKVITSRDALALTDVPKRLVVIGGGYIGTEMGTVYGKLGSEVHIIEMMDRLLPGLEAEIVDVVAKRLTKFNVTAHLKTKALGLDEDGDTLKVRIEEDGKENSIEADKVLVVVGRKPCSMDMGLENTKVKTDDKGFIKVDKTMRTDDPKIFAIGDVAGQPMLAHKATREAKVAAEVASGKASAFDNRVIPFVVFNDPEISSVGLTESEAKEKGLDIEVGRFPFAALGRALTLNQTDGFVKVIAEKGSNEVLGVQAVGPGASDMISEAALAIEMGATVEDISLTIHPHPTLPEGLMEAAEATMGAAIHIYSPRKD
ncbi:MAG: dihydrolipoyl dehydrogenase [archaeon]